MRFVHNIRISVFIICILAIMSCKKSTSEESKSGRPEGMSEADYKYTQDKFRGAGMNKQQADEASRAVRDVQRANGK